MRKAFKWIGWVAGVVLVLAVLAAGAAYGLQRWLNSDDFRQRAEREASSALGLPVRLGGLSVDLWPLPAVAVDRVVVQARPALTLGRVELRPVWTALLGGRMAVSSLIVREAVLPQPAIDAIAAGLRAKAAPATAAPSAGQAAAAVAWPQRIVLDRVTWIDAKGRRMTLNAEADLDGEGLPEAVSFAIVDGRLAGARGDARRQGDQWPVRVALGGGRITGPLRLQAAGGGMRVLSGELVTQDVEVGALTAPDRPLTGRLQAQTTLRASFREPGQLADAMVTQTRFTVRDALIKGIDLAAAVQTVGLSRGGSTRLDTLAGQVATQGRAVHVTQLVATSGALSAQGNVSIAPAGSLSGRVTVDLNSSKGSVGIPLAVGGTVDNPSVTLTRGAMLGAAIGTLVAPGAGTAAGASQGEQIGEKLKGLFGR